MLNAGQPGFVNAPVTKLVVGVVVIATLFGSILGSQKRLVLSMDAVFKYGQVWRLATHNFVFSTPGELLFGVVLLYYFRQFERQMGSSRFAALATFVAAFHTAGLCLFHFLLPSSTPSPASGPYALVFACLVRFAFDTPALYVFQIVGSLSLSDKTFPYILALQLALSAPARSLPPMLTATMAGLAARIPFIAQRLDTPKVLVNLFSSTLLPLLNTAPPPSRILPSQRTRQRRGRPNQGETNAAAAERDEARPISTVEAQASVSGAHIDTLIAMGFSRQSSIAALLRANDDVQMATEQLLAEAAQ